MKAYKSTKIQRCIDSLCTSVVFLRPYLSVAFLLLLCLVLPSAALPPQKATICIKDAMLFHFSHANIWHFAVNALFLARFKPRWSTVLLSYFVASACGEMAFAGVSAPTCGISAMCFAMIARHDVAWRVLNWQLLLVNGITAFLPMFNWKIHLASYALSFALWKLIYLARSK